MCLHLWGTSCSVDESCHTGTKYLKLQVQKCFLKLLKPQRNCAGGTEPFSLGTGMFAVKLGGIRVWTFYKGEVICKYREQIRPFPVLVPGGPGTAEHAAHCPQWWSWFGFSRCSALEFSPCSLHQKRFWCVSFPTGPGWLASWVWPQFLCRVSEPPLAACFGSPLLEKLLQKAYTFSYNLVPAPNGQQTLCRCCNQVWAVGIFRSCVFVRSCRKRSGIIFWMVLLQSWTLPETSVTSFLFPLQGHAGERYL